MAPGDSYDPRTWREGIDYSRGGKPLGPPRGGALPLLLSGAILLGGAAFAYASGGEAPKAALAAQP